MTTSMHFNSGCVRLGWRNVEVSLHVHNTVKSILAGVKVTTLDMMVGSHQ